jgi:hypothetical protein
VKLVYYCPTCDARVRGVGVRLKRKRVRAGRGRVTAAR